MSYEDLNGWLRPAEPASSQQVELIEDELLLEKEWIVKREPQKKRYLSAAFKAVKFPFSYAAVSIPVFVYAVGAHLAVQFDQFTDAHIDPRNDWSIDGKCSVYAGLGRFYSYSSKSHADVPPGTVIVPDARTAYSKCLSILDNPFFRPAVSADLDLYIKTEKGFDGFANTSNEGVQAFYEPEQKQEAIQELKDFRYYALRRKVQTVGHFGDRDWWQLQGETAVREVESWPSRAYSTMSEKAGELSARANNAYNGVIDGTISLLQRAKNPEAPKEPSPSTLEIG